MDVDRFVEDCVAANKEGDAQAAVRDVLARTVAEPKAVRKALGEHKRAGINVLYRSDTLTIFDAVWTPQMNLMPHDHLMWANIGIYSGREDNIFWERSGNSIDAVGVKALFEGDAEMLPIEAIHSVTNPLLKFTGGIHIYGGDFFDTPRSLWDPESLEEGPSDGEIVKQIFEDENKRLGLDQ